ncbi:MAG TPA: multidrug efflux RND transporter permease subunit [Steroidobacteraceae bacterium]|nr:multidrug efflux RND transporter permease subunit [Steroidobacteraceae bacterium]
MNISKFFIERPVFAAVLSGFILIAGAISLFKLPVSEYPEVVPPSIVVRASYPGANPQVISETVAGPLEQEIVGVEDMLYMSSQATLDGNLNLTITFRIGTDIDRAQVQVQNRVSSALPRLPEEVRQLGVSTTKTSPDLMMAVNLVSKDHRYDALYLRNYAVLNVKDELARLPGMGSVQVFGAGDYAMRIWIDPEKLAVRGLTTGDVARAIREQNIQVAAGQIAAPPSPGAEFQIALDTMGRLQDEQQFRDIVIKTGAGGEVLRLGDVARVEMGANTYALRGRVDHDETVTIPIYQAPGSNALELAGKVRATMDRLRGQFPAGMDYRIIYDPTVFVRQSIDSVIVTLLEAIGLVVLVVILFLQTWRASIIPLVAVPVSVVGSFAVLHALGFSINTLSLFGLVLAIGIVVDDAIVVVENVERHIANGLSPMQATIKAMSEVSRPIIAITLVLCAVFIPVAFVDGLTGQFYKQFALTIAISTVISAFNSLTLSPALAALLLKPHGAKKDRVSSVMDKLFGRFFKRFNRGFDKASHAYQGALSLTLRRTGIALVIYVGLLGFTALGLNRVPTGFIPGQDKLYLVSVVQLPPGATIDRTEEIVKQVAEIGLKDPGVEGALQFAGMSPNNYNTQTNSGLVFFALKPFKTRENPANAATAMAARLNGQMAGIREAFIGVFPPPPIQGLGSMGGFKLNVEDRGNAGSQALYEAIQQVIAKAATDPALAGVYSTYQVNVPQIHVDVDRVKVKQQGVELTDVFQTLQATMGSSYVNDFNRFGRTYRVMMQADAQFRNESQDILALKVRNSAGNMVPLGSMVTLKPGYGPDFVERFNAYRSADITGGAAAGHSSGEAQAAIARILQQTLPQGMSFEWTELAYQQQSASGTALLVFPLCVLFVFLVLAAQYESFKLPLAIVLIVPLALLAGLVGVMIQGGDSNVFTQVGFLVLVALASKNAILIVEFAKHLQEDGTGRSPLQAVLEAAKLRLRPILMTSIAFIMGVVPLVLAHGAGAEVRRAMGATVFAGMIGVTLFGLFLTPVFYVLVQRRKTRAALPAPALPSLPALASPESSHG